MGEARNPAAPGGWKFQTTASVETFVGSASRELWSWFAVRRPLCRNAGQSLEQPCKDPMTIIERRKQVSLSRCIVGASFLRSNYWHESGERGSRWDSLPCSRSRTIHLLTQPLSRRFESAELCHSQRQSHSPGALRKLRLPATTGWQWFARVQLISHEPRREGLPGRPFQRQFALANLLLLPHRDPSTGREKNCAPQALPRVTRGSFHLLGSFHNLRKGAGRRAETQ